MGKISIRTTRTSSGNTAVQVVRYVDRKVKVLHHIGSGSTAAEVAALKESAEEVRETLSKQSTLFEETPNRVLPLATTTLGNIQYTWGHELLQVMVKRLCLDVLPRSLLDLALIRLLEPSSLSRSLTQLERFFGIRHARRSVTRVFRTLHEHKEVVEKAAVAASSLGDLSLVLYDVTTLYFETHAEDDEVRSRGFSKDNKPQQPQVVIGLLADRRGLPLGYELFPGKTFEGHTMLSLLDTFSNHHNVKTKTVVADAAMLSRENIAMLDERDYFYIVGARLSNLPQALREQISMEVPKKHGALRRFDTDRGELIVAFSRDRYLKDKGDMKRQWKRAERLVSQQEAGRRAKFVKKDGGKYRLDKRMREKTEMLLGLKGYHTNIPEKTLSSAEIMERYGDLWKIEKAFRMAKSDLAARPIFHHVEHAIRSHLLVCFTALLIGTHIEHSTDWSLRRVRDLLFTITDAHLIDEASGQTFVVRSKLTDEAREFVEKIRSY